jgi:hypothetical protein
MPGFKSKVLEEVQQLLKDRLPEYSWEDFLQRHKEVLKKQQWEGLKVWQFSMCNLAAAAVVLQNVCFLCVHVCVASLLTHLAVPSSPFYLSC